MTVHVCALLSACVFGFVDSRIKAYVNLEFSKPICCVVSFPAHNYVYLRSLGIYVDLANTFFRGVRSVQLYIMWLYVC